MQRLRLFVGGGRTEGDLQIQKEYFFVIFEKKNLLQLGDERFCEKESTHVDDIVIIYGFW